MIGIDTNIIIEVLKNKVPIKLSETADELCTSEIVVYEMIYSIYASKDFSEKQLIEFYALLDTFTYVFSIDRKSVLKAAEIAANLKKIGRPIQQSDALIAGSLVANGCTKFATKNVKDFVNIKDLQLVSV